MAKDKLKNVKKTIAFIKTSLDEMISHDVLPIVVCIGSDLAIGDSLGPLTGTLLKAATKGLPCSIYGSLDDRVDATNLEYIKCVLEYNHLGAPIIAIDAAVGDPEDVGCVKVKKEPLYPGKGANKDIDCIGDISIMGIVAQKGVGLILGNIRLSLVYSMAQIIAKAVSAFLKERLKEKNLLPKNT